MRNLKVLVTGGAGFIGSHLIYALKNRCEVTVIDNLSLGDKRNVPKDVFFKRMSVADLECSHVQYDVVFHLGIPSSSPMYKANPYLVGRTINEMITVLECCKRWDAKLIYASTSSIYNGNPLPFREDMPVYVSDFYTECRYAMERLANLYYELYRVPSVGLRFFSVYGENEWHKGKYANLVSQFLWSIMKDEPPVIFGDGSQTRDFIYVGDVVGALLKSMRFLLENNVCEIFNVGTGRAYSFNELVGIINRMLGKNVQPKYVENPIPNYVFHTLADTKKAGKILGFKAKVTLEKGVEIVWKRSQNVKLSLVKIERRGSAE